jgi:sortase family protein
VALRQGDPSPGGGSMPTGGANRPGPFGFRTDEPAAKGSEPIAIQLERLGIDTDVVAGELALGVPADPPSPQVTIWYRNSAQLGAIGVVVIGGKTTVTPEGPSAFTRLNEATPGDLVVLTGQNGGSYSYMLDAVNAAATAPDLTTVLEQQQSEQLLLIGWDQTYPDTTSDQTLVVASGTRTP